MNNKSNLYFKLIFFKDIFQIMIIMKIDLLVLSVKRVGFKFDQVTVGGPFGF